MAWVSHLVGVQWPVKSTNSFSLFPSLTIGFIAERGCVFAGFTRVQPLDRLLLFNHNNEISLLRETCKYHPPYSKDRNYSRYRLQNWFVWKITSELVQENSIRWRTWQCYLCWYQGSLPVAVKSSVCWRHGWLYVFLNKGFRCELPVGYDKTIPVAYMFYNGSFDFVLLLNCSPFNLARLPTFRHVVVFLKRSRPLILFKKRISY